MIRTFTYRYDRVENADKEVNTYLQELKNKDIKYTVQTNSAGNASGVYYFVTVISEQ